MSPAGKMAAVVLAAGRSSRMGTSKPLLPLGSATVIERVVGSISRAGVDEIIVVTGHAADALTPVLDKLPVRPVHNADYDSGMFSSVQTGARALDADTEAFFILPADYPLVRTEVLDMLIKDFRDGGHGVTHPSCRGLRGHPPLLTGRHATALAGADSGDDLGSFLRRHADDQTEVDVEDVTILMDMDTAEDFQRIGRFAAILDAAPPSSLAPQDALYLLSLLEVPDQIVKHSQIVAIIGETLAEALKPRVPALDVDLVRTACLLHDMAKGRPGHASVAQRILSNLGLPRLGAIAGTHMVMPPHALDTPSVTEAQLVYLADKMVIKEQFSGVEGKEAHAFRKHGDNPDALEGAKARMRTARIIRDRVESILERPLEEVLPREKLSST
jgi:molybdenum cofactor cytidylyltransferase